MCAFLTYEHLLYEFPRGNYGLPRVSHHLRAELIGNFGVWKTKVPDLAQVELAHTQNILS